MSIRRAFLRGTVGRDRSSTTEKAVLAAAQRFSLGLVLVCVSLSSTTHCSKSQACCVFAVGQVDVKGLSHAAVRSGRVGAWIVVSKIALELSKAWLVQSSNTNITWAVTLQDRCPSDVVRLSCEMVDMVLSKRDKQISARLEEDHQPPNEEADVSIAPQYNEQRTLNGAHTRIEEEDI